MGIETRGQIDKFLATLAGAPRRLLMLDYDGTLAPFARKRGDAYPYPGVVPVLEEIVKRGRTRLVIVSGRDIDDLSSHLGIEPLPELFGTYGRQRRRPVGKVENAPLEQRHLEALSNADRWLEYQQLREMKEVKTGSIAVHWRGLKEPQAEEIRARVRLGWVPIAEQGGLQLFDFDGGVEICAPGPDKGDVVRMLLAEEGRGVASAYLGDDSSDEPAFRAIRDGGLSVLVRPTRRQTAAQLWLHPPEELVEFLKAWASVCCEDRGTRAAALDR